MDPMQNPEEGHDMSSKPEKGPQHPGKEQFESAWRKTREGIESMKQQAAESIEAARERLRERVRTGMAQQKNRSVKSLKRLSSVIRDAAARLDDEGEQTLAEYTHLVAAQVKRAADYLDQRDPGTVLREAEDLVRRQAGLVVGGMFVTGLIAARLLKSAHGPEPSATESASEELNMPTPPPAAEPPKSIIPPSASSRFGSQGIGPTET